MSFKKVTPLFISVFALLLTACEGEEVDWNNLPQFIDTYLDYGSKFYFNFLSPDQTFSAFLVLFVLMLMLALLWCVSGALTYLDFHDHDERSNAIWALFAILTVAWCACYWFVTSTLMQLTTQEAPLSITDIADALNWFSVATLISLPAQFVPLLWAWQTTLLSPMVSVFWQGFNFFICLLVLLLAIGARWKNLLLYLWVSPFTWMLNYLMIYNLVKFIDQAYSKDNIFEQILTLGFWNGAYAVGIWLFTLFLYIVIPITIPVVAVVREKRHTNVTVNIPSPLERLASATTSVYVTGNGLPSPRFSPPPSVNTHTD